MSAARSLRHPYQNQAQSLSPTCLPLHVLPRSLPSQPPGNPMFSTRVAISTAACCHNPSLLPRVPSVILYNLPIQLPLSPDLPTNPFSHLPTNLMSSTTGRRFLSLPAVEPCGSVSPATLLSTSIALGREIATFRAASFPVHRAIARDSIRQIRLLLPFLESLPDTPTVVPALLELYIVFQKLHILLQDCSLRGTRLLLLLRSDRVLNEFRRLNASIVTSLDAFLLLKDEEMVDLLRLAAEQSRRDRIRTDAADEWAIATARSVMTGFQEDIPPERRSIQRLLEHLGIRSWSACNEEVCFLEEEIRLSSSGRAGQETVLLSSLLALALYARSVCCETPDLPPKRAGSPDPNPRVTAFDRINPDEFRCPISLDLMTDPVTVSTGQTYNRSSILPWFKAGNSTCPVTGEKLVHTDLLPNLALLNVIRQYCLSKRVPMPENIAGGNSRSTDRSKLPTCTAAANSMRMISGYLVEKLRDGHNEERCRAVYEIRLLARSSVFNRSCLVDSGAVPWLLHLLGSWDPFTQEQAMAALLNLSKHPDGRKAVVDSGGLVSVLDMLENGSSIDTQFNAAAALFYISSVDEYRQTIGETPGAIASLVGLLNCRISRGKHNAAAAILALLGFAGNHRRVIAAGAVPILASIVSPTEREDLVLDALAVLAALAERTEGSEAIIGELCTVKSMAEVLRSSDSQTAKEACVSILLCLCNNGGGVAIGRLDGLPALMPSLYTQLTQGSQRASKKASSLISILHRSSEARAAVVTERRGETAIHGR